MITRKGNESERKQHDGTKSSAAKSMRRGTHVAGLVCESQIAVLELREEKREIRRVIRDYPRRQRLVDAFVVHGIRNVERQKRKEVCAPPLRVIDVIQNQLTINNWMELPSGRGPILGRWKLLQRVLLRFGIEKL